MGCMVHVAMRVWVAGRGKVVPLWDAGPKEQTGGRVDGAAGLA